MLFRNKEDLPSGPPEMSHGPPGDRHADSNASSQEKHHHLGPNPQQKWFYMMPMMHEMWHDEEHKSHRGCHRWHRKRGMDHREMSPEEYQEMVHKMHKAREEYFKGHHRHGCWRRFGAGRNEDKQNPTSEYFFQKQTLHSNLYC